MRIFFLAFLLTMTGFSASAQNALPMLDDEDLNFNLKTDAFGNKITQDPEHADRIKVDTTQSLSENLRENAPDGTVIKPQNIKGKAQNWVKELMDSAPQVKGKNSDSLQDMVNQSKLQKRASNASVFDIAGIMLRMSYEQAEEALTKRGYKKTTQKMDIPNFIRWRNEEKCRNQGVVGYERLEGCIIKLAQKENYQFISSAEFNKFDTKETVRFYLTSNFTNNKVYKVTYQTEAANNTGNSTKAMYLRNIKVYDFWKKINQRYGTPDDQEKITWGLGGDKPYLKAVTGFLLLEDPELFKLDTSRMTREDQRFIHTDIYTF